MIDAPWLPGLLLILADQPGLPGLLLLILAARSH